MALRLYLITHPRKIPLRIFHPLPALLYRYGLKPVLSALNPLLPVVLGVETAGTGLAKAMGWVFPN